MATRAWLAPPIDWTVPDGPGDWLLGTGATRAERAVVWATVAAGTAAVVGVALHAGVGWRWWQWALVLVVGVDVVAGVPANALSTTKRLYRSRPAGASPVTRLLRHPLGFTGLHLHPFVLAAALPGTPWGWAAAWYAACVAGTALVVGVPVYLQRPVAFSVGALAGVLAPLVAAPDGLRWFGPLLVLKLVLAHAVREEPYRPGPMTTTTQAGVREVAQAPVARAWSRIWSRRARRRGRRRGAPRRGGPDGGRARHGPPREQRQHHGP